jgi:hypothetical protein
MQRFPISTDETRFLQNRGVGKWSIECYLELKHLFLLLVHSQGGFGVPVVIAATDRAWNLTQPG